MPDNVKEYEPDTRISYLQMLLPILIFRKANARAQIPKLIARYIYEISRQVINGSQHTSQSNRIRRLTTCIVPQSHWGVSMVGTAN